MRYCNKCGIQVNEADDYCNTCGYNLTRSETPTPDRSKAPPAPPRTILTSNTVSPTPTRSGKTLWYIISGVLLVTLIAFGFLYSSTSSKLNTANTKITSLESEITARQHNIDTLNTQLTTEKANVTSLQTQLNNEKANVTKLTSDLSTSQTSLAMAQGQIKTLQASMDVANASVTKLTSDLSAANAKIIALQASLDKANADLTTATSNLSKAAADLATMTTNFNNANTNYKKVADPRFFYSIQELNDWLAKDDTNTNPAYASLRGTEKSYILQIKAARDGFLISVFSDWDTQYIYYGNTTIAGGMICEINPLTDAVRQGPTFVTPSHPLPLP
jgi:peptidoglycan hydrolase CwlO-like protein